MRLAALGMDHEDTHRSAMDVYARWGFRLDTRLQPPLVSPPPHTGRITEAASPSRFPPHPLRRRAAVLMRQHEPLSSPVFAAFATAISTCLEMVARAAAMPGEGFALSKSLQASSPISTSQSRPP